MFEKSAAYYDALYSWKKYGEETARIVEIVRGLNPSAKTLLDVACGTGKHLELLRSEFECEGVDLSPDFVRIASDRNPGVPIHQADFRNFDLGRRFDVATCLFSAIGYVRGEGELRQAAACIARHLNPGGVALVEPWFSPEAFIPGGTHHLFVETPELKIARMNRSDVIADMSVMDMHHLVATPTEVEHFVERHELCLLTREQYVGAFRAAGLEVEFDDEGLMGRGLVVGVRG